MGKVRTDKYKESVRRWRERNPEKVKEMYRRYYAKNREKLLARKRARYAEASAAFQVIRDASADARVWLGAA